MALKEYITDNGQKIPLDWATEETLFEILQVIKRNSSDNSKKKSNSKRRKEDDDKASKSTKEFSDNIEKTTFKTKKLFQSYGKLSKKAERLTDTFSRTDGTVKSTVSNLTKLVGISGLLGGSIGFFIGSLEKMATTTVDLAENGFLLGGKYLDVYNEILSKANLNMEEFNTLINNNGDVVRFFGNTTVEAAKRFAGLSDEVKKQAEQFGRFGYSNAEFNNEFAEYMSQFIALGNSRNAIEKSAADNFTKLNKEVFLMAQMTGRSRRDAIRARDMVKSDVATQILLQEKLGSKGIQRVNEIVSQFGVMFKDDKITDIFKSFVATSLTGFENLPAEAIAIIEKSGMAKVFRNVTERIRKDGTFTAEEAYELAQNFRNTIKDSNPEELSRLLKVFQKTGNPMSDTLESLLSGFLDLNKVFSKYKTKEEFSESLKEQERIMRESKNMLKLTSDFNRMLKDFKSSFIKGFLGVTNLDSKDIEKTYERMSDLMKAFGSSLRYIVETTIDIKEWLSRQYKGLLDFFGVGKDTDGKQDNTKTANIASMVTIIGGLFAAPAVIMGTIKAITGLFMKKVVVTALKTGIGRLFSRPMASNSRGMVKIQKVLKNW